jgi:hypothetical protein
VEHLARLAGLDLADVRCEHTEKGSSLSIVAMNAYALQRAIYDYLNPRGRPGTAALDAALLRARYGLGDAEITAVLEGDVATLYRLGVHPVLLNSYARARVPRDRYRAALAGLETEAPGG